MDVRTAVERDLREVLLAEYGGEMMPEGPEYEFVPLLTFWEKVAGAVNRTLSRAGYGEPITSVSIDGFAEDGSALLIFQLNGEFCVTAIAPYPLTEDDYEGVVGVAVEVFEKSVELLRKHASVYLLQMEYDNVPECPECWWTTSCFAFLASSKEEAERKAREIAEAFQKWKEDDSEVCWAELGVMCPSCLARKLSVGKFSLEDLECEIKEGGAR